MHDPHSGAEDSTFQLVLDQLEELVLTVIEELRERPGVALAIVAAIVGAVVGSRLATASNRRRSAPRQVAKRARRVGDAAELAGLGLRLLQNPIVRGLVMAALERQLKRRFSI